MKLSKEAQEKMKEIQALENKYGLIVFRAGLAHLVDVGLNNFDDDSVEEGIRQILKQGEVDKSNGVMPIMTPAFQCEILRCTADLAKFSPWTLFCYIKKHVVVDI